MRLFSSARPTALGCMHLVNKCLLLFMLVLLAQSAFSLFLPGTGQYAGDIDIMVRTSAAAIFGYLLSANFIRQDSTSGQSPAARQPRILEAGAGQSGDSGTPTARIGFTADAAQPQAASGGVQTQAGSAGTRPAGGSCLQIAVATAIGLFCLAALLVLRNLDQLGLLSDQPAVSATVTQFRDFVSACVGFLIGCPARQSDAASQ